MCAFNRFNGSYDRDCPLECNTEDFTVELSSQTFSQDVDMGLFVLAGSAFNRSAYNSSKGSLQELKQSIARVNVFYKDLGYNQLDEIAFFTFVDFVSEVGGLLGLFLNMSLMSIIEIGELAVEFLVHLWKKQQNKKLTN